MLSVASYDRTYVEVTRGRIAASVEAYQAQVGGKALPAFEHEFFKALVMALDHYFDHRARGQEGKDGNALNEVRMLCGSFMHGDGKLMADSTIKYDPAKAVLGFSVGDEIVLTEAGFSRLAEAFLAQIENRIPDAMSPRRMPGSIMRSLNLLWWRRHLVMDFRPSPE